MNVTEIMTLIIQIIGALTVAFLIPWIKEQVSAEKLAKILSYVKLFVGAAEQVYAVTDGEEKKKYVIQKLAEKGIVYNEDVIDAAIEAEVLRLHKELEK